MWEIMLKEFFYLISYTFLAACSSHSPDPDFSSENKEEVAINPPLQKFSNIAAPQPEIPYFLNFEECKITTSDIQDFDRHSFSEDSYDCVLFKSSDYKYLAASFYNKVGRLPYFAMSRNDVQKKSENIAIILVGGPTDHIWHGFNNETTKLFQGLANKFDKIIVPGYYGTAYRSAYPRIGINAAAQEILLLDDYIKANTNANTYYVSFSSGGDIIDTMLEDRANSALLINPGLIPTYEIAEKRYKKEPELKKLKRVPVYNDGKGYDFGRTRGSRHRWADYEPWVRAYFGTYYENKSILDNDIYISEKHGCLKIIAGKDDQRIGVEESKRYPNRKAVTFIDGMNHFIDTPIEREYVYEYIDTLLKNEKCKLHAQDIN